MIRCNRLRLLLLSAGMAALLVCSAFGQSKPQKTDAGQLVDSGSFGIYVNGRRVATESFEIRQNAQGSVTRSSLKVENGSTKIGQTTELLMDGIGNVRLVVDNEHAEGCGIFRHG